MKAVNKQRFEKKLMKPPAVRGLGLEAGDTQNT